MVSCSQPRIIDKELLLMPDVLEFAFRTSMSNQNTLCWNAPTPILDHFVNRRCGLMGENKIENGIHEDIELIIGQSKNEAAGGFALNCT